MLLREHLCFIFLFIYFQNTSRIKQKHQKQMAIGNSLYGSGDWKETAKNIIIPFIYWKIKC